MQKDIAIQLKKVIDTSYTVTVGKGLLARLPSILLAEHPAQSYVIVADSATAKLFGKKLLTNIRRAGGKALLLSVPSGEVSKSEARKSMLENAMLRAGVNRKGIVLALGGGVVGDLAGFVSATYMRGIPYIQLPTTLLAMVDSSIGGKTGINTPLGKNLIGAFHQPRAVYADIDTLKSLSRKELCNGLVEVAKMFMTFDADSFAFLKANLGAVLAKTPGVLADIISRAVRLKARVVIADERENGERMILNFGHTIGHALEKLSGYKLLHGEAVGVGILVEARIARNLGRLSPADLTAIESLLKELEVPVFVLQRFNPAKVVRMTLGDKKSVFGKARYVILKTIGKVHAKGGNCVEHVEDSVVLRALREVGVGEF